MLLPMVVQYEIETTTDNSRMPTRLKRSPPLYPRGIARRFEGLTLPSSRLRTLQTMPKDPLPMVSTTSYSPTEAPGMFATPMPAAGNTIISTGLLGRKESRVWPS
jgi:hypothetical protein